MLRQLWIATCKILREWYMGDMSGRALGAVEEGFTVVSFVHASVEVDSSGQSPAVHDFRRSWNPSVCRRWLDGRREDVSLPFSLQAILKLLHHNGFCFLMSLHERSRRFFVGKTVSNVLSVLVRGSKQVSFNRLMEGDTFSCWTPPSVCEIPMASCVHISAYAPKVCTRSFDVRCRSLLVRFPEGLAAEIL